MTQEKDHKGEVDAAAPSRARETGPRQGAPQTLVGVPKMPSLRPPPSSRPPRPASQPPRPSGSKPVSGPLSREPSVPSFPGPRSSAPRSATPRAKPLHDGPLDRVPLEEISSSLLLPDESTSTATLPGLEELSGSLLLEDPNEGRPAAAVAQPAPAVQPAAATPRSLPMPELPTSTPGPNLDAFAAQLPSRSTLPLGGQVTQAAQPEPTAHPGHRLDSGAMPTLAMPAVSGSVVPPPPAHMFEALHGYEASGPPGAVAAPAADPAADGFGEATVALPPAPTFDPALHQAGPTAPMTGDVEVTSLPRGRGVVMLDGLRHAMENGRRGFDSLKASIAASSAPHGPRRRVFLGAIALAGLVVGVAVVGIIVSLTRKSPEEIEARAVPAPSAEPAAPAPAASEATSAAAAPAAEPSVAQAAPAPVPESPASVTPCKVQGKPRVIAPSALVQAGIEVRTVGNDVALGFAPNEHQATALRVDAANLATGSTIDAQSADAIRRVVPLGSPDGSLTLAADADHDGDALHGRRTVTLDPPLEVGATAGSLVWAHPGGPAAGKLWPLDGDGNVEALRAATESEPSGPLTAIAFRLDGAIWVGTATGRDALTPMGPLYKAGGSAGSVGSPAIALNDGVVLVAWADRAAAQDPWRLRWVRFKAGEVPGEAGTFTPPAGGKGEQAMSPGITSVPGGRFLLVWTEGPASKHDVRALTLSREGQPIGKPLDISNKSGNSGQGQAALNAARQGVVAFLESNEGGFEVVATPIACGP